MKMSKVVERFLKYVAFDTTSDEESTACPSTEKQLILAKYLADELENIGLKDVYLDGNGYVYGTVPKNTEEPFPTIGFIAHMDTSPDASGTDVKPILYPNYDGKDIVLNGITISPAEFPLIKKYIGDTIITADGTTLLGADDKAGVAEIVTAAEILMSVGLSHGDIKIAFTPDEEIGRGADLFDVKKFNADFAYTMDGGDMGELEYENFNAAKADITISGKSVHPGYAKGVMVNASVLAAEFINNMPQNERPETTDGYEGFYHITDIKSSVSEAKISLIIRDFDTESFKSRCEYIKSAAKELGIKYGVDIKADITEQYLNMAETFKDKMYIISLAEEAFKKAGVTPGIRPIRGGTDGARLSFMGLPCPNIFAGGHNFHGPYEFVPVSAMEKAAEIIVNICTMAKGL